MKFLFCVDDTDDLTKETSTGAVAERICQETIALGGKIEIGISRHQLLLHEDIAYTSHNSSMCFAAEIEEEKLPAVWGKAVEALKQEMAAASDPGLCLCRRDQLSDADALIDFGRRAQKEVLTKEEAYEVAKKAGGVRLEEFGGTGMGIIGALAGIGLRLSGNDGTLRGKDGRKKGQGQGQGGGQGKGGGQKKENAEPLTMSVAEMKKLLPVEAIISLEGRLLGDEEQVILLEFAKRVFIDHKVMAVAQEKEDGTREMCSKMELYENGKKVGNWISQCAKFALDNDYEEMYGDHEENNCTNCLFRRWTADGFECMKEV